MVKWRPEWRSPGQPISSACGENVVRSSRLPSGATVASNSRRSPRACRGPHPKQGFSGGFSAGPWTVEALPPLSVSSGPGSPPVERARPRSAPRFLADRRRDLSTATRPRELVAHPKTLVVAEKFNTALRIAVVLSDGRMKRARIAGTNIFEFDRPDGMYAVAGLRGHIVELDYPEEFKEWTLVGLPQLLETPPLKRVTEGGIVSALQSIVRGFDRVIIATDFDREGELIGLECLELLQKVHPTILVKRARYSALTREVIEQSFAKLEELDHALAEAAEARQEIDLVWGALLTRYLSLTAGQRGRSFLSVGRVQTPTLALLVERDQAIKEFVPTPFWELRATGALENIEIYPQARARHLDRPGGGGGHLPPGRRTRRRAPSASSRRRRPGVGHPSPSPRPYSWPRRPGSVSEPRMRCGSRRTSTPRV